MFYLYIGIFGLALAITIIIIEGDRWRKRRHKHRHFSLQATFSNKINNTIMASVNTVTLTDLLAHTALITLVDNYGNAYSGTLSNPQITGLDSTLDTVKIDPANPEQLDVTAISETGGNTITLTGDWTSQGNATSRPNPDSTKPGSEAIPDGTVKTGVGCTITIINKATRTFALQATFQ